MVGATWPLCVVFQTAQLLRITIPQAVSTGRGLKIAYHHGLWVDVGT